MKEWSRRVKDGESRYMTRACVDEGYIIIKQTERGNNPKMEVRSVVMLSLTDFKAMVKALTEGEVAQLKHTKKELEL